MADHYRSFQELAVGERESIDYQVRVHRRQSRIAVLAPHGGKIEPGTSELAEYIAREDFSFYAFEGMRSGHNSRLGIPSDCFDEPECASLLEHCELAIAIHGVPGQDHDVRIGGGNALLREKLTTMLQAAGFQVVEDDTSSNTADLCNRPGPGLRIEVSKKLRDRFVSYPRDMDRFVSCIRAVLLQITLEQERTKDVAAR